MVSGETLRMSYQQLMLGSMTLWYSVVWIFVTDIS